MGSLLVVTGPPGAGKSTVSARLAALPDRSMLVRGDAFFGFIGTGGIDPWLPDSAEQNRTVTRAAGAATGELVRAYDTVYDGVLGPWFLPIFLEAAGLEEIDYVVLLPDVETCVARVSTRSEHAFTDHRATRHMHREFSGAAPERHVVDSTHLDPSETVERILERRSAGALRL